jgi:hypothetical protein
MFGSSTPSFDFIQYVKRREHSLGFLIASGVFADLVIVNGPQVFQGLCEVWRALSSFGIEDNSVWMCLLGLGMTVLSLLGLLAGLAIWVLSAYIAWAAFLKSRKKAYLFILAFFLMPLALDPATWLSRHIVNEIRCYRVRSTEDDLKICQARPIMPLPSVVTLKIYLPVGPFLLLAGLWYLYREETTTDADRASPPGRTID